MPFRDQTGPAGAGPMTGRGLGNCSSTRPGPATPGLHRGGGFGRGFGRRCSWFVGRRENQTTAQDNVNSLRDTARSLRESLKEIEARMDSLQEEK